jgi:protein NirF
MRAALHLLWLIAASLLLAACAGAPLRESGSAVQLRGTGDLGLVIERASGHVTLVNTTSREAYARIGGLGDLSHASAVYSRDARYAYVFGRDGGLTKLDLLEARIVKRVMQSGNAHRWFDLTGRPNCRGAELHAGRDQGLRCR